MAKKTKTSKRPVGRPRRVFTPEEIAMIEEMAGDGCHTLTIANATGIPEETLRDNFRVVMTQKRAENKWDARKTLKSQSKGDGKAAAASTIFRCKADCDMAESQDLNVNLTGAVNLLTFGSPEAIAAAKKDAEGTDA